MKTPQQLGAAYREAICRQAEAVVKLVLATLDQAPRAQLAQAQFDAEAATAIAQAATAGFLPLVFACEANVGVGLDYKPRGES